MIDHVVIQDQLFAYLDGDLDDAQRNAVDAHVGSCAECAQELALTRRANELFHTVEPQPLPEGFMARLQARIQETHATGDSHPCGVIVDEIPRGVCNAPTNDVTCEATGISGHKEARGNASFREKQGNGKNGAVLFLHTVDPALRSSALPSPDGVNRASFSTRRGLRQWMAMAACLAIVASLGILLARGLGGKPLAMEPVVLAASQGTIDLEREGSVTSVEQSLALQPGDGLTTADDTRAIMTLGNGGSVRLAPDSHMRLLALNNQGEGGRLDVKIQLTSGSIWVEEAGGVHCTLQAGNSLVIPVGTTYEATVTDGSCQVNVWDGSVQVHPLRDDQDQTRLVAGQQAEMTRNDVKLGLIDPRLAEHNAFTMWNRRLERPTHPDRRGPLSSPRLSPTASTPSWFSSPPPVPSRQGRRHGNAPASTTTREGASDPGSTAPSGDGEETEPQPHDEENASGTSTPSTQQPMDRQGSSGETSQSHGDVQRGSQLPPTFTSPASPANPTPRVMYATPPVVGPASGLRETPRPAANAPRSRPGETQPHRYSQPVGGGRYPHADPYRHEPPGAVYRQSFNNPGQRTDGVPRPYPHFQQRPAATSGPQGRPSGSQWNPGGGRWNNGGNPSPGGGAWNHSVGNPTPSGGQWNHSGGNPTPGGGRWNHSVGNPSPGGGAWNHSVGNPTPGGGAWNHSVGNPTPGGGAWNHSVGNPTPSGGAWNHGGNPSPGGGAWNHGGNPSPGGGAWNHSGGNWNPNGGAWNHNGGPTGGPRRRHDHER